MKYRHHIPAPQDSAYLQQLLQATPARIGVWRSGTRPLTCDLLKFRADHAAAQDSVNGTVSEELLAGLDLPVLQTMVRDKDEYLTRPDLGRKLSTTGKAYFQQSTSEKRQVQLIISDGLSAQAIEANLSDFLPAFQLGLAYYRISCHRPVFVKYGRVRLLEDVATVVAAEVFVILIGERPGLVTAKSMSAYLVYQPTADTMDADYLVLSNIYSGGTPPVEAAAQLARMVNHVIQVKSSGVSLKLITLKE
ncbi:ethanolamine ammonia-lyase subunit EutC [Desulfotruncus alcoholivorax]|uniref:ethanolamine ammonia-lyase subunit EutC n=1 Tax=Desulfotruncus alcoholivorax TaxID=265477 RepID=UPI0004041769|nr:ethanolamine ammonia-lyase subunit EutC [Desulfotruncus alcoholivorax]